MQREIGMLSGKLDMLIESVRRSEEKSDVSRASIHRRMDEMTDRMGKVEATVSDVQDDVKDMRPVVDEVQVWRQRGIGALAIVGVGASALTFVVTKFGSDLWAWLLAR
ncbi:hypothetical protein J2T09_002372 [Neorhizobium huautlense]|uniref:DUF1515 domain-containing protein n=1 Tax=Neorhizobium huautlense TaxID=67774 RepID=A0ABT9PTX6_9HYPH|nr:DUF1515 family protein [Neorhizobium huautlense]MDP9837620.1 hypothetical protein [Neorhizobium huautlense]